jgi:urease accessory protein
MIEQRPPLRVVRAFAHADGAAAVHLHNVSGGVLGGDRLEMRVDVGASARAQLTTTGATRLYRSRNEATAVQLTDVTIGRDALLEYMPDTLIPFAGARYEQHTRITLGQGAGLFWWETIAPGRTARDEVFAYDLLHLTLDILADSKLIALERVRLEPRIRPLTAFGRLGSYRYCTSFYICRHGIDAARWHVYEAQLADMAEQCSVQHDYIWGVTMLPAHGLLVRGLSSSAPALVRGLHEFWRAAKRLIYGQEPILPRKLY